MIQVIQLVRVQSEATYNQAGYMQRHAAKYGH